MIYWYLEYVSTLYRWRFARHHPFRPYARKTIRDGFWSAFDAWAQSDMLYLASQGQEVP